MEGTACGTDLDLSQTSVLFIDCERWWTGLTPCSLAAALTSASRRCVPVVLVSSSFCLFCVRAACGAQTLRVFESTLLHHAHSHLVHQLDELALAHLLFLVVIEDNTCFAKQTVRLASPVHHCCPSFLFYPSFLLHKQPRSFFSWSNLIRVIPIVSLRMEVCRILIRRIWFLSQLLNGEGFGGNRLPTISVCTCLKGQRPLSHLLQ